MIYSSKKVFMLMSAIESIIVNPLFLIFHDRKAVTFWCKSSNFLVQKQ